MKKTKKAKLKVVGMKEFRIDLNEAHREMERYRRGVKRLKKMCRELTELKENLRMEEDAMRRELERNL